jgi:type III restriction enzyme
VTKDIWAAKALGDRLAAFIKSEGKPSGKKGEVLVVTSDPAHVGNVTKLSTVDASSSPIEWIVSVSMLSEGWDVQNVFQIVPHEQRAFNSKLLIAQVLGRGLRIPPAFKGSQPEVVVFNHERWAAAIRHLVDEVMENDVRLASYPVPDRSTYNFELHQIAYKQAERTETISPAKGGVDILKSGKIVLVPQAARIKRRVRYEMAGTKAAREDAVDIDYRLRPVEEVAARVRNRLKSIDMEEGTR